MSTILQIEKILREELLLYREVSALEEKKSGAIMSRSGALLDSLSAEQEKLLIRIALIEGKRLELIEKYRQENTSTSLPPQLTLGDLATSLEERDAGRLRALGTELRNLLWKIQALSETNEKMARDNIEYFNVMLSEIKNRVSLNTGYDAKAVEKRTFDNPLMFSRMV